MTTSC